MPSARAPSARPWCAPSSRRNRTGRRGGPICRWAASAPSRRSPISSPSSPPTKPPTSPARPMPPMAASRRPMSSARIEPARRSDALRRLLLRCFLAQRGILALAARLAGGLGLAQLGTFGPVERLLRGLGLALHLALLGGEFRLAVVVGERRGDASLAFIALGTGSLELGLGPQPMVMVAQMGPPILLPKLIGALADLLLMLRPVGHGRLTSSSVMTSPQPGDRPPAPIT